MSEFWRPCILHQCVDGLPSCRSGLTGITLDGEGRCPPGWCPAPKPTDFGNDCSLSQLSPPSRSREERTVGLPGSGHLPASQGVERSAAPDLKVNVLSMKRTPQQNLAQSRLTSSGRELRVHPVAQAAESTKVKAPPCAPVNPPEQQTVMHISPPDAANTGRGLTPIH